MKATLDHTNNEAKNIITFRFKTEESLRYTAGQFIEATIPHENPDERGEKHWFTLSSSPTEELISITTKFSDPSSTFKAALKSLQPGDSITISEPMGDFVLPKDPTIPLLFVAGGIGVTPMRSMVKWLLDTGEKRNIRLIYAMQSLDFAAFLSMFEAYGIEPELILSSPPEGWKGRTGHLTAKNILEISGDLDESLVYLSGPEPMIETLSNDLKLLGVASSSIITDFFPGYTSI